ncbi:MAG: SIMPL domain-containing protein [Deltaproteobacteria bacterium]|nr:SIMPL domain-containing protein [Deltaproteobacteria bacterium]
MKRLFYVVFVLMLVLSVPAIGMAGQDDGRRTVMVQDFAEGELDAEYATVSLDVTHVSEKSASESYEATVTTMKKLYASLKKTGMKEDDIKKSLIVQRMRRDYRNEDGKFVPGYFSTVLLEITLKDIGMLGSVYAALSGFDSVTIGRTAFKRHDEAGQKEKLLKKALLSARARAEVMAKTLDAAVGEALQISATDMSEQYQGPAFGMVSYKGAPSDDVGGDYGRRRLKIMVNVSFELK